ncbi:hypothetical protein ACFQ4C_24730 [Larkinella insperata]|uniref:Uncharacterized protein n=1 Tax=Larkinella insperata TaxID=332158 RepID=A0ABW3QEQ9_9BACT|nr:hypothetical protein [Larkinella insperata]
MNRNSEDQPWEDRFRKLGKLDRAQPRPFFYARLEARLKAKLKNQNEPSEAAAVLPWWLQKPAYALGTLGLLIAMNVAVALWQNRPAAPEADPGTYEAFVQDYQLNHQTAFVDE